MKLTRNHKRLLISIWIPVWISVCLYCISALAMYLATDTTDPMEVFGAKFGMYSLGILGGHILAVRPIMVIRARMIARRSF